MSYYHTCPYCGAHLDPGEVCDCAASRYERLTPENRGKFDAMVNEILRKQNAPASVRSTDRGGVEQIA